MTAIDTAATEVCAALEYLLDRGELPDSIPEILTHVRYTQTKVDHFDLICDGRTVRFSVTDIGEATVATCPECGEAIVKENETWKHEAPDDECPDSDIEDPYPSA